LKFAHKFLTLPSNSNLQISRLIALLLIRSTEAKVIS
jgi:hypothetical protein